MIHGDLKIEIPDCPYIWDFFDIRETFQANCISLTREQFMSLLNLELDAIFDNPNNDSLADRENIIKFIELSIELAQQQEKFKELQFFRINQKVPINSSEQRISFHSHTFRNDCGDFLDSAYSTTFSWNIIPLRGIINLLGVERREKVEPDPDPFAETQNIAPLSALSLQSASVNRRRVMNASKLNRLRFFGNTIVNERQRDLNRHMGIVTASELEKLAIYNDKRLFEYTKTDLSINRMKTKNQNNNILTYGPKNLGRLSFQENNLEINKDVLFLTVVHHSGVLSFTLNYVELFRLNCEDTKVKCHLLEN